MDFQSLNTAIMLFSLTVASLATAYSSISFNGIIVKLVVLFLSFVIVLVVIVSFVVNEVLKKKYNSKQTEYHDDIYFKFKEFHEQNVENKKNLPTNIMRKIEFYMTKEAPKDHSDRSKAFPISLKNLLEKENGTKMNSVKKVVYFDESTAMNILIKKK